MARILHVISSRSWVASARRITPIDCRAWSPRRKRTSPRCPTRWRSCSTRAAGRGRFASACASTASTGPASRRRWRSRGSRPSFARRIGREGPEYHAAFDAGDARTLRDLFEIVKERPDLEVRVDGKRLPYAHELWLPLVWMFVGGEA